MKIPGILAAALLSTLLFFLQYVLSHINGFGIPVEYQTLVAGFIGVIVTALGKYLQEKNADATPAPRGMDGPAQQSVARRVWLG